MRLTQAVETEFKTLSAYPWDAVSQRVADLQAASENQAQKLNGSDRQNCVAGGTFDHGWDPRWLQPTVTRRDESRQSARVPLRPPDCAGSRGVGFA